MGRKAENILPFNDQAVRKRIKEAVRQPRKEWRVEGQNGLVLVTQPTGSATWYLFYTNAQHQVRKFRLGEHIPDVFGLKEAREKATAQRALIDQGADPVGQASELSKTLTFEQLAEKFINESPTLSATTRNVYRYALKKDAYPFIGKLPAGSVTKDHVIEICQRIERTGASTQSERTKTTIGGVYRWAMRERLASSNPCAGIGRRSHKVARNRTPSDVELEKLWAGVSSKDTKLSEAMRTIIKLAIITGQRRTEVAGVRVSELHLEGKEPRWVIPGDVNKRGKLIEGRTKNGREQVVPLSPQAVALFHEILSLETRDKKSEYVFPAQIATVKIGKAPRLPHIHGESVTMAMRRLRADVGVDDISIHDMRRAVSNWMKDEGISREVRDLVLNHTDPSVTEAHYSQGARMERQVRAALVAWASHVWEITGQSVEASNVIAMKA
jgi:integrase